MSSPPRSEAPPDIANELRRELLDPEAQRVLSVEDVLRASETFFGSPDLLALYGMPPVTYHERGIRLASRTAIECVVDCSSAGIAAAVRRFLGGEPQARSIAAIDLFAGSGNLLYHVARAVQASVAVGFEIDELVYRLTRKNFERIGFDASLEHGSCESLLDDRRVPPDSLCLAIIAPPWGTGFDFARGLDLRRTDPPIHETLQLIRERLRRRNVLCVVHTHEVLVEESVVALAEGRRVYARGITSGLPTGRNVGYLICSP